MVLVGARTDEIQQTAVGRGAFGQEPRHLHFAQRGRQPVERTRP